MINLLGIPLILKQQVSLNDTVGQTHEQELARNREPLLFSFCNQTTSLTCIMKVDSDLYKNDDNHKVLV